MGVNYFRRDDRDLKFVLFEQLDLEKILGYEAFQDYSIDDFNMIIDEAMKVCRDVLGPSLKDGDEIGCKYEDRKVITPDSFKECWQVMAENGWMSMTQSPEFGGQGMPGTVGGLVSELFSAANMAFQTFPGLTVGNGHLIEAFGTEEDKALFVEKMYTGEWGGTMCLTEPNAGSDVGYLTTKAIPIPDSDDPRIYRIEGNKCFITSGEHDLTENIIHLVLARIEGAPEGTKGVSLFAVPKIWVNPDGSMGEPNDCYCGGIEHKMGIHGSSTAQLVFGENGTCRGILLGEPHSGMAKMFQMMNEARLGTGLQAQALLGAAYDTARTYAKERYQGPPFTDRNAERVPIIQHEDIRRMLMNLKSGTEAMRGFLGKMFWVMDVAKHDPDEEVRKFHKGLEELLMPIAKAYVTDSAFMLIRDAIQVLGGVGYCSEFPVEQYMRDCKILSIWEGTNFIQSLDLVGRKMMMNGGKVFQDWLQSVMDFTSAHKDDPDFAGDFKTLFKAAGVVGEYAMKFMEFFQNGTMKQIPLHSTRFLDCMGDVCMAQTILEQALIAREKLAQAAEGSKDYYYYTGKIETAKYFCRNTLFNVFSRQMALQKGDTSAIDIPEECF